MLAPPPAAPAVLAPATAELLVTDAAVGADLRGAAGRPVTASVPVAVLPVTESPTPLSVILPEPPTPPFDPVLALRHRPTGHGSTGCGVDDRTG